VSEPASISAGIAQRYAKAIFELAQADKQIKTLETDIGTLDSALRDSADFAAMIQSPLYSRAMQQNAITALSKAMGLSSLTTNTLLLMTSKRRLFVLPHLLRTLRAMIADEKGIVTAEVTSATVLTKAQSKKLADTLKSTIGKDIKIKATVDESLIGGLVVKVGSRMIDTSLSARLASLQNAMKEVG
jgi:F-type H+-transporting ATPase subunit delta